MKINKIIQRTFSRWLAPRRPTAGAREVSSRIRRIQQEQQLRY